jgi:hypothetical protein
MKLTKHLKTAFRSNAEVAERHKDDDQDPNDYASPACVAVAHDLGFTKEEADELMKACLYMAAPRMHPSQARKNMAFATLAVGAFYGVMAKIRQERLH